MTDSSSRPRFVGTLDDLEAVIGSTLGPADLVEVGQERITRFADATDDHQWIHVDADRAAGGPFGTTIAHGYLTLAMVPHFLDELIEVRGVEMGVNYGLNKVRFPAPLPSGTPITARVTIGDVDRSGADARVAYDVSVQADGLERPVCVAQVLVLYVA